MDRRELRKEFLLKNEADHAEMAKIRHEELIKKLLAHKYGGHKNTKGEENAR